MSTRREPALGILSSTGISRSRYAPPLLLAAVSASISLLFGVCMTACYARGRRKHQLPPWAGLPQGDER
jgi:hypothetical protein